MFVLVALLLSLWLANSMAAEKDRSFETSSGSGDGRQAPGRRPPPGQTVVVDSKAITKLISDINAAARTDKRRMLSIIVINTNVAAATLEQQKARTGLTLGDVYVAHALSLATRKKFDTIVCFETRRSKLGPNRPLAQCLAPRQRGDAKGDDEEFVAVG